MKAPVDPQATVPLSMRPALPKDWLEFGRWNTQIVFYTSVNRLLVVHGSLVLASRHPQVTPAVQAVAVEIAGNIEIMLEAQGLSAPPQGWRGDAP